MLLRELLGEAALVFTEQLEPFGLVAAALADELGRDWPGFDGGAERSGRDPSEKPRRTPHAHDGRRRNSCRADLCSAGPAVPSMVHIERPLCRSECDRARLSDDVGR